MNCQMDLPTRGRSKKIRRGLKAGRQVVIFIVNIIIIICCCCCSIFALTQPRPDPPLPTPRGGDTVRLGSITPLTRPPSAPPSPRSCLDHHQLDSLIALSQTASPPSPSPPAADRAKSRYRKQTSCSSPSSPTSAPFELQRGLASVRPPYAHRPCPVDSDADRHDVAIFIVVAALHRD
jgi:hypothetical protein